MQAKKKPSSIDVARLAGVSQSAVSRSFAPGASVAPATRAKVLRAANELGYRPNELARMVFAKASSLIGIVMGELTNPFYPEVLELLLTELEAQGYRVLLKRLGDSATADEAVEEVLRYRVRGAIITSSVISDAMAESCGKSEVPVVLLNRRVDALNVAAVTCDNVAAGRMVADRLAAAGHQRFAFISGSDTATTNLDRKKGFLDRLAERGFAPALLAEGGANEHAAGYAAATELLARSPAVDAVFCASDILAFGAIDAWRKQGLRIPEDLSVVGFDDVPTAAWPAYDLTTVRQPRRQMVHEAVRILLRRINGDLTSRISLCPGRLIERSTARPVLETEASVAESLLTI